MNVITKSIGSACGQHAEPTTPSVDNPIEREVRAAAEQKSVRLADAVWKGVLTRLENQKLKPDDKQRD